MDDYYEKIGCIFILLLIAFIIIIVFFINYYNLSKFKHCYDNEFKYQYCVKYKNY